MQEWQIPFLFYRARGPLHIFFGIHPANVVHLAEPQKTAEKTSKKTCKNPSFRYFPLYFAHMWAFWIFILFLIW